MLAPLLRSALVTLRIAGYFVSDFRKACLGPLSSSALLQLTPATSFPGNLILVGSHSIDQFFIALFYPFHEVKSLAEPSAPRMSRTTSRSALSSV